MTSLLDDTYHDEEDFTGRVRRNWQGRPYILADPNWSKREAIARGFTLKTAEPRGLSRLYTRTTTYVGCMEDTYALGEWQQRMVAIGLAMRPSLIAKLQNVNYKGNPDEIRKEVNEIARQAKEVAEWHEKADLGTAFHKTAEIYDVTGAIPSMLSEITLASLKAYIRATKGWEYAAIEQFMVNDMN